MAFVGRLHPLLIHFPIALVIAAALAEGAAVVTADDGWRTVGVENVRAGAVFALLATIAGWRLGWRRKWRCRTLVPVTGHVGGLLGWGRKLLRP